MSSYRAPLYDQIQDSLLEFIESGKYRVGEKIPSERELSESFGVSRMTVRHALETLIGRGIIRRDGTRGTIVAQPKLVRNQPGLVGLGEILRSQGVHVVTQTIEFHIVEATASLARKLKVLKNSSVTQLKRVRLWDAEPLSLETAWVSRLLAPFDKKDLEAAGNSLYKVLKEKYGLVPVKVYQSIEVTQATEYEAKILKVPPKFPLLLMENIAVSESGEPLEYAKSLSRGDRYKIQSEVSHYHPSVK